jgi:hypothetical protein
LGFQSNVSTTGATRPSPGARLITLLEDLTDKAHDPMLLPALAAGLWVEQLHNENYQSGKMLRVIQKDVGLMGSYLPAQKLIQQPMEFDAVHRNIVSQHAYLTNGMSEFIADLFPSTTNAIKTFRTLRCLQQQQQQQLQGQQTPAFEIMEELDEYINHMQIRARAELQHHDRMLSRMNVYLQVVSQLPRFSCLD